MERLNLVTFYSDPLNSEAKHLSKFESGAVRFYKKGYVDSNGIETIGNGEMFSAPLDEFNAAYKAHNGKTNKTPILRRD
jgi:hypothetical protein